MDSKRKSLRKPQSNKSETGSAVFSRLFGADFKPPTAAAPPTMPVVDVSRVLKKSVLDAVLADIASLKMKVGTADGTRLDQHLANIRSIENRLAMTPDTFAVQAKCGLPTNPTLPSESGGHEALAERMTAMSGLIAMALACDQTRVFSLMFTGSVCSTVFWEVNATGGHHDLTHNEGGDQPTVQASTVFTMKQFATLLTTLKAIPEGAGNLLDNCAILASSCVAEGQPHSLTDLICGCAGAWGGISSWGRRRMGHTSSGSYRGGEGGEGEGEEEKNLKPGWK